MDDLQILTFDLVKTPSVAAAVVTPVTRAVMMPDDYKNHNALGYHDPDNDPMGYAHSPRKRRSSAAASRPPGGGAVPAYSSQRQP